MRLPNLLKGATWVYLHSIYSWVCATTTYLTDINEPFYLPFLAWAHTVTQFCWWYPQWAWSKCRHVGTDTSSSSAKRHFGCTAEEKAPQREWSLHCLFLYSSTESTVFSLFFYVLSLNLLKYGKEAGGTALNASNEWNVEECYSSKIIFFSHFNSLASFAGSPKS